MSDDASGYPGAPPDWYPDPAGGPGKRWWDGYAWTDAVVLPTQTPPPPAPSTGAGPGYATPAYGLPGHEMHGYGTAGYGTPWYSAAPVGNAPGLLTDELRISRMARVAVVIPAVGSLLGLINLRVHAAQYRTIGHEYHTIFQASQNGQTAPTFTVPSGFYDGFTTLVTLFSLCTVAAIVVACIWQYRAASTARALGLPTRHSPGWGVGSWFVPVVNLWMPYQALRDCLGSDDANRALVGRFWAVLVGSSVLYAAAVLAAFFSTPVALVISVVAALGWLGVASVAPRVVGAVGTAHQHALRHPEVGTPVAG